MAKGNKEALGNPNWEPGKSGNPKGRPKGVKSLTQTLRDMMDATEIQLNVTVNKPDKEPEIKTFSIKTDQTIKYAVSLALVTKALEGDISAINSIYDRLEGRVETREPRKEETEFRTLSIEDKRSKIIQLFHRVA